MKRTTKVSLVIALGLFAALLVGGAAMAGSEPLVGTWHSRDGGSSNLFWFVDDPIGGVYHVLYYDDHTFPTVCLDEGPMLWAGFGQKTGNTLEGTFGEYWCPDNSNGVETELLALNPGEFRLIYDPDTDTISAHLFATALGSGGFPCVGTRQSDIETVEDAIEELDEGKYPPSGIGVDLGCEGLDPEDDDFEEDDDDDDDDD